MRLKITKWEKYNPRSELKSMPWLRVQNTIVFSRKLFGMNPAQKWFWICLLAFAAQQNSDEFEIDLPWAEHETGVTQKDMLEAIKHFQEKGLLTIIEHAGGTDAVRTRYTNGTDAIESVSNGRNVTDVTDVTERNEQNGDTIVSLVGGLPDVKKKKPRKKKEPEYTDWDFGIARQLRKAVLNKNPNADIPETRLPNWADDLRLLREKHKPEIIEKALDWTFKDSWWSSTVQSPSGLKNNWNQITAKMNSKKEMSLDAIASEAARRASEPVDPNEIPF